MSVNAWRTHRRSLSAVGIWTLWAVVAAAIVAALATGDNRVLVLAALAVLLIPITGAGLENGDARERTPRPRPVHQARHPKPPAGSIHSLGRTVDYAGPRPTIDRMARMGYRDAPAPGRVHYNHVHVGRRRRPHWGWGIAVAVAVAIAAAAIATRRCQR